MRTASVTLPRRPEPKLRPMTYRLPEDLLGAVRRAARHHEVSANQLVRTALQDYLQRLSQRDGSDHLSA